MNIESQSAVAPETAAAPEGAEVDEVQAFIDSLASGGGTSRHEFPIGPATTTNGRRLEAAILLLAPVLPVLVRANRHVPLYVGHQLVLRADGTFAVCKHPYPKLPRKRIDEHAKLIRAACDHRNQRLQHEPIAVDGVAMYHGAVEVLSLVLAHFLDAKKVYSRDPERALFAAAEPAFKDLDWA
jgi:hypothetical protein